MPDVERDTLTVRETLPALPAPTGQDLAELKAGPRVAYHHPRGVRQVPQGTRELSLSLLDGTFEHAV